MNAIIAELQRMMAERVELATVKREAEAELDKLDNEIKATMIEHGLQDDDFEMEIDGERKVMRIQGGTNTYYNPKKIKKTLLALDFDADDIEWFMGEVADVKEYDYVAVVNKKKGEEADGGQDES